MAMEIESLGLAVDSSQLKEGSANLERFGQTARQAAEGADTLTKATERLGGASGGINLAQQEAAARAEATRRAIEELEAINDRWVLGIVRQAQALQHTRSEMIEMEAAGRGLNKAQQEAVSQSVAVIRSYEQQAASMRKVADEARATREEANKVPTTGGIVQAGLDYLKLGTGIEVARIAIDKVIGTARDAAAAFMQWQSAMVGLQAMLEITGGRVDRTSEQIANMAQKMSRTTVFDDASIIRASTVMLRFGDITGSQFDRAIKLAGDLASVMGTDITSAAEMVGRALENAYGTMMLRRAGLMTDAQIEYLRVLKEFAGDQAYANELLAALEQKASGLAEKIGARGLGNAFTQLGHEVEDSYISLGKEVEATIHLESAVRAITAAMRLMHGEKYGDVFKDSREGASKYVEILATAVTLLDKLAKMPVQAPIMLGSIAAQIMGMPRGGNPFLGGAPPTPPPTNYISPAEMDAQAAAQTRLARAEEQETEARRLSTEAMNTNIQLAKELNELYPKTLSQEEQRVYWETKWHEMAKVNGEQYQKVIALYGDEQKAMEAWIGSKTGAATAAAHFQDAMKQVESRLRSSATAYEEAGAAADQLTPSMKLLTELKASDWWKDLTEHQQQWIINSLNVSSQLDLQTAAFNKFEQTLNGMVEGFQKSQQQYEQQAASLLKYGEASHNASQTALELYLATDKAKEGLAEVERKAPGAAQAVVAEARAQAAAADAAGQYLKSVQASTKAWQDLHNTIMEAGRAALQTLQQQVDKQREYNHELNLTEEEKAKEKVAAAARDIADVMAMMDKVRTMLNQPLRPDIDTSGLKQVPPMVETVRDSMAKPIALHIDAEAAKRDILDILDTTSQRHNLDPRILRAIAIQESSLNQNAVNSQTGAAGMFQFIPATAKSYGIDPFSVRQSAEATAQMLTENLERFQGDIVDAVKAHFGGPSKTNWGPQTELYGQQIMARIAAMPEVTLRVNTEQVQGAVLSVDQLNARVKQLQEQTSSAQGSAEIAIRAKIDVDNAEKGLEQIKKALSVTLQQIAEQGMTPKLRLELQQELSDMAAILPILNERKQLLEDAGPLKTIRDMNEATVQNVARLDDELRAINARNLALGQTRDVVDLLKASQYDTDTIERQRELAKEERDLAVFRESKSKDVIAAQEKLVANLRAEIAARQEIRASMAATPAQDVRASSQADIATLDQELQKLRQRGEEIGANREEVTRLRAARERDVEIMRVQLELSDDLYSLEREGQRMSPAEHDALVARVEWLERRLVLLKDIGKQLDSNAAREANQRAVEQYHREWEGLFHSIDDGLADAIMSGFDKGKSFAEEFKRALTDIFKNLVLRPIIQFMIAPIAGSMAQLIGSILPGFGTGGQSLLQAGGASWANFPGMQGANSILGNYNPFSGNQFVTGPVGQAIGLSGFPSALATGVMLPQTAAIGGGATFGFGAGSAFGVGTAGIDLSTSGIIGGGSTLMPSGFGMGAALPTGIGGALASALPWIGLGLGAASMFGLFDKEPSQVRGQFRIAPTETTTGFEDSQYTRTRFGNIGFSDEATQYFSGQAAQTFNKIIQSALDAVAARMTPDQIGRTTTALQGLQFGSFEGEYTTEDFIKKYGGDVLQKVVTTAMNELDPVLGKLIKDFKGTAEETAAFGNTLLAIFDKAGGPITEFDQSVATLVEHFDEGSDKLLQYASDLIDLHKIITSSPIEEFNKAWTQANESLMSSLDRQAEALDPLIENWDGSYKSTHDLAVATAAYNTTLQNLLVQIKQVKDAVQDMFASAQQNIALSGMRRQDEQGNWVADVPKQYQYWQDEAKRIREEIAQATDPTKISQLSQQWLTAINNAFNLLTPEQQVAQTNQWLQVLNDANQFVQDRLDEIGHGAVAQATGIYERIGTKLDNIAGSMDEAAATIDKAAAKIDDGGTKIAQGGSDLLAATSKPLVIQLVDARGNPLPPSDKARNEVNLTP